MQFEFATATRIVFGPGVLSQLAPTVGAMGRRALIVDGAAPGMSAPLLLDLGKSGVDVLTFAVTGEPTVELVQQGLTLARECDRDVIIGFGGGSAVDTGKAIAALLANGGEPLDYMEVIGRGKALTKASIPFIAVPTTAGTGAEVTRNAVLLSHEHKQKASMRSPFMYPRLALVDPELTYRLPAAITASTGLDALTQLIEPYVSVRANPLTDGICREGMVRAAGSLLRAFEHGDDSTARSDMALASLFGGLALANAGLGAAHGFAAPIGGAFPAPHGAVCARLLPPVMTANVAALKEREPDNPVIALYDEVARLVTGNDHAEASDGVKWVADLAEKLDVPPLSEYGITQDDVAALVADAAAASSMKANPIRLTADELTRILEEAL